MFSAGITRLFVAAVVVMAVFSAMAIPTGSELPNWYKAFSLDEKRRDFDFSATLYQSNGVGNMFYRGEKPEVMIQIENLTDKALEYKGVIELIDYRTENIDGDIWYPVVFNNGVIEKKTVEIKIPPKGYQNICYVPELPEKFGGYAIVIDLGAHGRLFVSSLARILKNESKSIQFPKQSSEIFHASVMGRLGMQAVRYGIPFQMKGSKERDELFKEMEQVFTQMKENNVAVTIEIGAGDFYRGQPLGLPRPHLDENNVMLQTKTDLAWLPERDEEFREFCYEIIGKYGWPRGPINGIMLWNEPWEGISISGWGADMLRYREMYKIMGEATHQANKDAGVEVLIGGCDSSSNTLDKLFPDDSDEFMKYFDFCSIHYQGLAAPSLYRRWINRKPARVLIWDTESWVANSEDLLPGVIAANRASGYDRSMGFFGGYVFGNNDHRGGYLQHNLRTEDGKKKTEIPLVAYPMAAGVSAMQYFIGNREFREIFFKQGLPWVFVFDGENGNTEDGTVVALGDLNTIFGNTAPYQNVHSLEENRDKEEIGRALGMSGFLKGTPEFNRMLEKYRELFPSRKINENNLRAQLEKLLDEPCPFRKVSLELKAAPEMFALFDCYGNKVEPADGRYVISMNTRGWYFKSVAKGGFAVLLDAFRQSSISGVERVEMKAKDFLMPVANGAKMILQVNNVTNESLEAKLAGRLGSLRIKYPETLTLKPFESKDFEIEVTDGAANPANQYPLDFTLTAGNEVIGKVTDVMRSNVIARRSIEVDGKLEDWKDVVPQVLSTTGEVEVTMMEQAWLPFEKLPQGSKARTALVYTAYDQEYFYVAVKAADPTEHPGTLRFETRDDDEFFYPEVSYKYDEEKTYMTTVQKEENAAAYGIEKPGKPGERIAECVRPKIMRTRFDFELPADRLTKVTLYFPWDSFRSGRQTSMIVVDTVSGKVLVPRKELWSINGGAFVSYEAGGKISVIITNHRWWHAQSARIGGVFLDPLDKAADGGRPTAALLGVDESNPGKWIGRFGQAGYLIPGANLAEFQSGYSCALRDDDVKLKLEWPKDVRRYSYRKRPVLPDGQAPAFDNLQIAFNAIPDDQDPIVVDALPGRMRGFVLDMLTDYEFALNRVAVQYGGGTEIWRMQVPDGVRKHFYPRQPKAPWEGAVKNGKLVIDYRDGTRFMEAASPWSEIPHVKALMEAGRPVKFTFRVNDESGAALEFGRGRSVTRPGFHTFHPDWRRSYSNEIEFSFQK